MVKLGKNFMKKLAMQIEEIIKNIKQLPEKDLKALIEWIDDYTQQMWDEELKRDIEEGKLNKLAKQALKDYEEGKYKELWDTLLLLPFGIIW